MRKRAARLLLRCMAAWVCTTIASLGWAVSIQSVSGAWQADGEVVRVELSEPWTHPVTGFTLHSPARIALDLPEVRNALGRSQVEFQLGNLRSAEVLETEGRSRIVLNLQTATAYRTEVRGSTILVLLDPVQQASVVPAPLASGPQWLQARPVRQATAVLNDIDFRRGADGAGRLIVDLGTSMVNVDVRRQARGVRLELLKTRLPEGLQRRLDVVDFGTPVQTVTARQSEANVHLDVEMVGEWVHSAYQSDGQFVLEVRPPKRDAAPLSTGSRFTGERLSLNFQNIEVRALLQVIADFTHLNIVASDAVAGALTLRLKEVPWDQALHIILEAKGLGVKQNGNVLWIAPKDEIAERTRKDFEAAREIEKIEPLRTEGFQINYAKAEDVKKQIADTNPGSDASTRLLSERGSAIAEPRTNQLFVTDTSSKLEEIADLLKKLDVPVRQVLIEARIVEARDTFGRSLGVKFGAANVGNLLGHNQWSSGAGYTDVTGKAGSGLTGPGTTNNPFLNLPASLSSGVTPASLAFAIFNRANTRFLALELSAMEAEGVGKIVSSPRLLTADQTQAVIEQGTEYPYTETAPNGATTVSFKKAVLKLEVIPQITPEGNIIMALDVSKDSRGESTSQGVAIDTKHIKTQVLVENGGTVVIGGIFEMEETHQTNKVPLLGDIPGLGNLFKNHTKESSKREMLVFITPRMVTDAWGRH